LSIGLVTWGRFPKRDQNGNYKLVTVPAPNTDPGKPYLWNYLCDQMPSIAPHFDFLQLPNQSKCWGGNGDGCDGYGVFDLRDLGSKPQQGSTETRYGGKPAYLNLFSIAHAWGLQVFIDVVLHQLMGENAGPGKFRYKDAYGGMNGMGATEPGWFRGAAGNNDPIPPFVPQDDVPNKFFDYAFGRERAHQKSNPARVVIEDSLDYGDWLFSVTGADGARLDDVKGTWAPFVREFCTSRAMRTKEFYGEYFEGNPQTLEWWATTWPMLSRAGVADFTNHWAMRDSCNNGNARALARGGFNNYYSDLAYVFVDNPDTDTSGGQQVISNKLLAYAYALTIACKRVMVYGRDYMPGSVWPGAYGLKPYLDNLSWVHRTLAYGRQSTLHADDKVLAIQRDGQGGKTGGSPGLVTILNFDEFANRKVTVDTCFWPGTQLHDFTGHIGDVTVGSRGEATVEVPKNSYRKGQSYVCLSWSGVESKPIQLQSLYTTQMIVGHEFRDTKEAEPEGVEVGKIVCQKGSRLKLELVSGKDVQFSLTDANGDEILARGEWSRTVPETGEVTIRAFAPKRTKFKVNVTYKGVLRWKS
jgi:alpha-amylase